MKELTQGLLGLGPLRKSAGYTQERFAEALGVTRSLLAAWEVGVTWPSSRWLPKMADLLGCEVDDLYRAGEAMTTTSSTASGPPSPSLGKATGEQEAFPVGKATGELEGFPAGKARGEAG